MATRLQLILAVFLSLFTAHSFGQKADGELITRTFKVDSMGSWDFSSERTPGPVVNAKRSIVQQGLQMQFARAGIHFPEDPLAPTPPTDKAMFLNERTRELVVRATREDLEQIEKMVAMMQKQPPLVEIEVRYVETPTVLPPIPFRPLPQGFTNLSVYTEKHAREAIRNFESTRGADVVTAPKVRTISGRQARVAVENSEPWIYQDPPKLPRDTSPDADPTPKSKGRLPFPPGFWPGDGVVLAR